MTHTCGSWRTVTPSAPPRLHPAAQKAYTLTACLIFNDRVQRFVDPVYQLGAAVCARPLLCQESADRHLLLVSPSWKPALIVKVQQEAQWGRHSGRRLFCSLCARNTLRGVYLICWYDGRGLVMPRPLSLGLSLVVSSCGSQRTPPLVLRLCSLCNCDC